MISNNRILERRYLSAEPVRDVGRTRYLYSTARQAIYQYFRKRPPGKILVPAYLPEGIYDPFRALGWKPVFYDVDEDTNLSAPELSALLEAHRPDVLVYIHYFGLRNPRNIDVLRSLNLSQTILLEDFAHTLPTPELPILGDLALFSFPKLVGVAEGGLLWFNNRNLLDRHAYGKRGLLGWTLGVKLQGRLQIHTHCDRLGLGETLCERLVARCFMNSSHYYAFLMKHYLAIDSSISPQTIRTLNRVDFVKIAERRRDIAEMYLAGLPAGYLMKLPRASYLAQPLFAFPVLVEDRAALDQHLRRHGICGLALSSRWWFGPPHADRTLRDKHFLLPLNHHLTDASVRRIIGAVRAYGDGDGEQPSATASAGTRSLRS